MTRTYWLSINYYLQQKWFIILLFLVNLGGTIYGFYWYKNQLLDTPKKWLIFVPDSPTASAFFTIFLLFYLFQKKFPLLEALASITLFKYGIWATAVILWGAWARVPSINEMIMLNTIDWVDVMLMTSHLAMAIQGILFFKKYSYGFLSIFIVGLWTFANDFIDYTQDVHPWLPRSLSSLDYTVGEYTLYLSGFTLLLFYFLSILRRKNE